MKKFKRFIPFTLAALMLFSSVACEETEPEVNGEYLAYRWVDSDLFENFDEMSKAELKDDFAAAVNYEWASTQERNFEYTIGAFGDVYRAVDANKRAMLDDESFQNKNVELVRIMDDLFIDWDYRNSLGVEPFKKYLGYIDDIQSIDDVSKYMIDNEKNPLGAALVELSYWTNDSLDEGMALIIQRPTLSLEKREDYIVMSQDGFESRKQVEDQVVYLLERAGYTKKEAKKVVKECFAFESKLNNLDYTDYTDYINMTDKSEVFEKAGKYPLEDMLNHYGIDDFEKLTGEINYIDKLETVYTEKNLEGIKSYFKVRLALGSMYVLDRETYDFYKESSLDKSNPFAERVDRNMNYLSFYLIGQSSLSGAMDQAYLDYYYDQETYDEIDECINLIRDKYKVLINQNENLSDESKAAVIDKLEKIQISIMKPSNTADFSDVELVSKEEGGSYLDALCVLNKLKYERVGDRIETPRPKAYWDINDKEISTTQVNAFYASTKNAIVINIGILEAPLYSRDASFEEKLACMGTIIGHEMSHAFDSRGIYYDAEGKYNGVVTSDELTAWSSASSQIIAHLSSHEPFDGSGSYNSSSTITGETIADIEGVRVCLLLAKDYEDFDYDLFFRSYAMHWRRLNTKYNETDLIKNDNHPLAYLRINYTLMQFEEFDETYDIKPGDGMYLDPAYRIKIW